MFNNPFVRFGLYAVAGLIVLVGLMLFLVSKPVKDRPSAEGLVDIADIGPGANKVSFESHGSRVVGLLYLPANYDSSGSWPAIVVNPPATGVKEQTAGRYAAEMADRGFIALAIDPRGFGESEGTYLLQDADVISDDIVAGVDWLINIPGVDPDRRFSLGVCAGSGYAAFAGTKSENILAVATVSPFLTSAEDNSGGAVRSALLKTAGALSGFWYGLTGRAVLAKVVPETDEEIARGRPIAVGMRDYYLPGEVGDVPNWRNGLNLMSVDSNLTFAIYDHAADVSKKPFFMAYGAEAVSREGAERFFDSVTGAKQKLEFPDAGHFDLYWRDSEVEPAADAIADFFNKVADDRQS